MVEFTSPEIERLQREIAHRLGYKLVGYRREYPAWTVRLESQRRADPSKPELPRASMRLTTLPGGAASGCRSIGMPACLCFNISTTAFS